ncbi:MAG TPA: TonB-dependent receptor, partial [Bacteroidales bacterium]|nr:TonB-dependent receptor [Bacteroidales bacterium]
FSSVGFAPQVFEIELNNDLTWNVLLKPSIELPGVEVIGEKVPTITETPLMSVIELPVRQVEMIPALLGEKDVLKAIQLMPGVHSGTEGTSGFYVRGGGADQNLIILDDATVYNASHLFGFFSIFNGDALKSIQLTKGGFPARYGGRLSSVLEMTMKDGNMERFAGEGGIGLVSSRLTLEGPIVKQKASFLVSGRRTYMFDILINPFMPEDERFGYYFYDLNAKVNYTINPKNRLFVSAYSGRDKFSAKFKDFFQRSEVGMYWQNHTATLRWNHLFNNRLFSNTSFIFSDYTMSIYMKEKYQQNWFELSYLSGIRDLSLKTDFFFTPHPNHTFRFGFLTTLHRFTPSAVVLRDDLANEFKREVNAINVVQSGLYIEDDMRIGNRIKMNAGIRFSHFIDNDRNYFRPEPRLSASYMLRPDFAVKASYAEMNQYIHLLSNTGLGLPTDLWVPSTRNVPPQTSRQVALGLAKDLKKRNLEVSIEGYYKKSENTLGYTEGASFLLINDPTGAEEVNWEENVTSGQAWAYGAEFLVQRKTGRLTGWIGYTLSWVQLQFDEVNNGEKFFARYDRRHDISVVATYEISDRLQISGTWVYGTGNAITLPIGEYPVFPHNSSLNNVNDYFWYHFVNDYGAKNSFRMAPYSRLDLALQFVRQRKHHRGIWEIGVYNAYNRKNPFFYFMGYDNYERRVLKYITLFPIIPSITYSFKF